MSNIASVRNMNVSDSSLYLLHGRSETGVSCCSIFFLSAFPSEVTWEPKAVWGNCCTVGKRAPDIQGRHDPSSGSTWETAALSELNHDT